MIVLPCPGESAWTMPEPERDRRARQDRERREVGHVDERGEVLADPAGHRGDRPDGR